MGPRLAVSSTQRPCEPLKQLITVYRQPDKSFRGRQAELSLRHLAANLA